MAHEITEMDGIVSSNNIVPWHGIGTVFADYPSKEEAYNAAFGWEPVEETMYRRIPSITPEGELIETYEEVTCDKLISRSDNGYVLGTANSGRGMVSNMELFDIAEALEAEARGDSPLRIETAGSLRGGEKVWLLVRLEEGIKIKNDVRGETIPFFALQNGHTRSGGAFKGQAVFTRICCHAEGTKMLWEGEWINVEDHPGVMGKNTEPGLGISLGGVPFKETVSLDHKYWARLRDSGESFHWVEARDMLSGSHEIAYPIDRTTVNPSDYWDDSRANDPETWWVIGNWVGDGHTRLEVKNPTNPRKLVTYTVSNPEVDARIMAYCRSLGFTGEGSSRQGCRQITMRDDSLYDLFHTIYKEWEDPIEGKSRGKNYQSKVPPHWFEYLPRHLQESFLEGYLSADGSSDTLKGGQILSSTSLELLLSCRRMFARLGKTTLLRTARKGQWVSNIEGRECVARPSWSLRIPDNPDTTLVRIEGDTLISQVTLVEWVPEATFIPLDIPEQDHQYITHFGLSHNCANTVRAADLEAKKRGTEFSFRHTGKIGDRIEEAKQALIFWKQGVAEYQEMMEHLYSIKVDDLTKEDFIAMFVPEPVTGNLISDRVKNNILNARQQMRDIIDGSTSEGFLSAGTLLGAGVEWSQHYKRTRGADEIARNENLFSRAYLDESKLTQGAMRIIKELVTV